MYCRGRELDRLINSCMQGGGKGSASTVASICRKCEVVKQGSEVNKRGVRGQSSSERGIRLQGVGTYGRGAFVGFSS